MYIRIYIYMYYLLIYLFLANSLISHRNGFIGIRSNVLRPQCAREFPRLRTIVQTRFTRKGRGIRKDDAWVTFILYRFRILFGFIFSSFFVLFYFTLSLYSSNKCLAKFSSFIKNKFLKMRK